jgi:hypothetical protein
VTSAAVPARGWLIGPLHDRCGGRYHELASHLPTIEPGQPWPEESRCAGGGPRPAPNIGAPFLHTPPVTRNSIGEWQDKHGRRRLMPVRPETANPDYLG